MPSYYNATKLADEIISCETTFDSLFEGLKKSNDFERQLNKLKAYYRRAFNKTQSECAGEDVLEEYKLLVLAVQELKAGNITANDAMEAIEDLADCRALEVLLLNIFKMCELLFWAAAAAACYVAAITVGLPMIACEPVLGLAVTVGTGALFLNTLDKCLDCFEQFESFDAVEAQATREKNTIGFFAPAALAPTEEAAEVEAPSLSSSR